MEKQFILRPLIESDAVGMLEWMHDEDTTRYLRLNGKDATMEDALRFINNAKDESVNLHRAISDENGSYLGTVSLKNIDKDKKEAEYAISLHPRARGTGAAFTATEKIIDAAFKDLKLERVYLNVLEENKRAVRFYNKFGFDYFEKTDTVFGGKSMTLLWYEVNNNRSK